MEKTENENPNKKNIQQPEETPLFEKMLSLAADIALSRFRIIKLIRQAYKKLTDPEKGMKLRQEVLDRVLLFIRMTKAVVTLEYRKLPWKSMVRVTAALLYFVTVADLIPDFIPLLGFTDDALIIAWVYNAIAVDLQEFEEWETTYAIEWDETY